MIVLSGFSRFPIFFTPDGRKSIGFRSNDHRLNKYVKSLKGKFVVIKSLKNLQYKSRFVLEKKAINPELKRENRFPKNIYVYPDKTPVKLMTNSLALGIILRGGRREIFVPLLSQRALDKREIDALEGIVEIKEFGLERFQIFLKKIGIEYEVLKELDNNHMILRLNDPEVNEEYKVLINKHGRIADVDFCIHNFQNLYLPELVMFVREYGSLHHLSGFQY